MPVPHVYLDECVDYKLVEALRALGFVASASQDAGMRAANDADQLAYAAAHRLLLLTHNHRDFRRLHAAYTRDGRPHAGIVTLPVTLPFARLILRTAMLLDWIGTMPDHRSRLFTWGRLQGWLEQGVRLPGYTEAEVPAALGRG